MKYPWKQKILESKKIELLLVALLLLAAIVIRAYHFGAPPIGVHQDEAMAAVDAKALADYGTDRYGMRYPVHFTAWRTSQMSVLLSYCMIPFIKLLGFSTVSTRLPMLVISCLGLLALYLFGRQLAGKWTGMIVLILGTISPWHYMQSRWSFDCNLFPHVFLIAVVLLIAGLKKKPLLYLSMVMFGLCSYAYGIADYSVPLFLLVVAIYLLRQQAVNWKELAACFVLYLVIVLPEFLSMLLTLLGKPGIETPLFTIPSFLSSNRGDDILFANFSWKQLWENIVWTFTTTWGSGDKSVTNTMVRFGPVYYITDLFFVIGLVSILRRLRGMEKTERYPYVALLAWLGMGLWVGIITKNVTVNRINIIFYPVLIIGGIGIARCIRKVHLLSVPIAAAYGVMALMMAQMYFGSWGELSRTYYYDPYIQALNYAHTIDCDAYYIYPDPQGIDAGATLGEILTMYTHQIDAHYYQGISNVQDGVELRPYKERYHYENVTAEIIAANEASGERVVYIVDSGQRELFDPEKYEITSFYDRFHVVKDKSKKRLSLELYRKCDKIMA